MSVAPPGETIFALASGRGRSGVAVLRVSGPRAGQALETLARSRPSDRPLPRQAVLRRLYGPTDECLDQALVLWFPGPHSFTGEDVVEFHVHGGAAVIAAVSDALAELPGVRPAEAGEFTRRAFENGRLDLTAAEGLADLVAAETAAQRRLAQRLADGELARRYEGWRQRLLRALAHFEAAIDFTDEDLPAGIEAVVRQDMGHLTAELHDHLNDDRASERLREGFHVALVGAPNVGKSSLLNSLAGRPAAIVSAQAGTTRDVIEVFLDLGGYPVIVADTAGLRTGGDEIENEGVVRAQQRAQQADVVVWVQQALDSESAAPSHAEALHDLSPLVVVNKIDLVAAKDRQVLDPSVLAVSARTGEGLPALLSALQQAIVERWGKQADPGPARQRHRIALQEAREALIRFAESQEAALAGEDLRLALRAVGRITGTASVEDLLDVIFADFCIGK